MKFQCRSTSPSHWDSWSIWIFRATLPGFVIPGQVLTVAGQQVANSKLRFRDAAIGMCRTPRRNMNPFVQDHARDRSSHQRFPPIPIETQHLRSQDLPNLGAIHVCEGLNLSIHLSYPAQPHSIRGSPSQWLKVAIAVQKDHDSGIHSQSGLHGFTSNNLRVTRDGLRVRDCFRQIFSQRAQQRRPLPIVGSIAREDYECSVRLG